MHNSILFQCFEEPEVLINCSHLAKPSTRITTPSITSPITDSTTTITTILETNDTTIPKDEETTLSPIPSTMDSIDSTIQTIQSNVTKTEANSSTENIDDLSTSQETNPMTQTEYSNESQTTKPIELDFTDSPIGRFTRVTIISTTKRRRDQPFGPEEYWIVLCIIAILLTVMAAFCGICIICYMPKEMRKTDPSSGMHCIHSHI